MEWISVKDKIYPQEDKARFLALGYVECDSCPDTHAHSLLSIHEAEYHMYNRNFENHVFSLTTQKYMYVTHWMPLPNPPKEKAI